MSNENEFVASLNRLEELPAPDSNQQDPKRDVESFDRRFGSLMSSIGEINRLNASYSAQTNNVLVMMAELWKDHRHELSDMSNRIRALETANLTVHSNNHKNASTHDLDSSENGDKDTVESANIINGGIELGTEEQVNGIDTTIPSATNDANLNESTSANEQVKCDTPNVSSVSTTINAEHDQSRNEISMQMLNETTPNNNKMEVFQEDEDDFHEIDVPEGGEEVNNNENESLHEKTIGINQSFENDSQIDQQMNKDDQSESNSTINVDHNKSPTLEQSNTRKRRRADKSLATEGSLENSLPIAEVSTSGSMTMSKRARVSSTLNRRESAEQVNTQSGVDSSDEDCQNGGVIDSSGEGEEGVEQSEDEESWLDSETELGEEKKGHYRIEILKLKCIEENCNAEVASRDELHRHLKFDHLTSSPYRCLAKGCLERFEQWNGHGLAAHVRDNHSDISTWSCPHCTKTFKSQTRLYMHLHYYHFEGQFKCGYGRCHYDRVATLRSQILSHQLSVHPKSTIYTCQFINCGKSFKQKGNLKVHQLIHTGVKPFRCVWTGCDKSFNYKDSLNAHQWIHQKIKPYKCTWNGCRYASTQERHVIRHIRTRHFHLPRTQTEQRELDIKDNRDPRDYLLNTTHQSDHNSTDSDDSDH